MRDHTESAISYTGSSIVADVSWDLFLSSSDSTSATHNYEIMVWLAALGGAAPIGYPTAIATPTINGVKFNLYKGTNSWTVFSFVAASETTSFSGDINNFLKYLTENEGVSSNNYLQSIGAGTEPFTGSGATFSVSQYSISIDA
jgi:xyloglucan-specific endo-beta-1,4-glucanase